MPHRSMYTNRSEVVAAESIIGEGYGQHRIVLNANGNIFLFCSCQKKHVIAVALTNHQRF